MAPAAPTLVYVLCLVTAAICACLLGRGYARSGQPLLFWSAICFVFLALNSLIVVIDLLLVPNIDLRLLRYALSLVAVGSMLYGLIWNER
ncbi:DUF5985 family protein [Novosphingobium sp. Gsoil 351]|uniref:DUF5985 family protein n=1 Tax=Novosphingobium sp. Gsoil 351 TaxID=2675225 RepID=UPI0012B46D8D|nr:DUF5985 family protein [Novosphingobium sp. Gsoil 351]QGN54123.1 hypothetical protein GKE62_05750 [Novosphingobium sp. Gsoil 351]